MCFMFVVRVFFKVFIYFTAPNKIFVSNFSNPRLKPGFCYKIKFLINVYVHVKNLQWLFCSRKIGIK